MGFYGNITDTSKTFFQFDRIFSSRKQMDFACATKQDGVYTGRFVLVKYDIEEIFDRKLTFYDFILFGYTTDENVMYIDHACSKPYIYTTYSSVFPTREEDWNLYYIKTEDNKFYIKLQEKSQFDPNAPEGTYYIADNYQENIKDRLVGLNAICYQKDIHTTIPSGAFYKCIGGSSNGIAQWQRIGDYSQYGNYLSNFQTDFHYYGNLFDYRGYDGTVWEKVYHQGVGQFVQVARLNGCIPAIEIYADPPTQLPTTAYIDAHSSSELYRIKIPSSWGFRFKEVTEEGKPSDQKITQIYYKYNNNNELETYNKEIDADLYFNLNPSVKIQGQEEPMSLQHSEYDLKDFNTSNEVLITPTGQSGKKYSQSDGTFIPQEDTYEVSVHMPAVGNMIAEGYDLIYGKGNILNEIIDKKLRPKDIKLYNGLDDDSLKEQGDPSLGGKTHNPETLAGNINIMHDVLGQIVVDLENFPLSPTDINKLPAQYIYRYNNEYYRKGSSYSLSELLEEDYRYTPVDNVTSSMFKINKYYYRNENAFIPATVYNPSLAQGGYYLRNINYTRYTPVQLERYIKGQYYWKDGENYYCDNSENIPYYENNIQYYKNLVTTNYTFTGAYSPYTYYYKENNNYFLSKTNFPSAQTYYDITVNPQNNSNEVLYYKPNLYYYQRNNFNDEEVGRYFLANDSHVLDKINNTYFKFIFNMDNPQYGTKENEVIQYYSALTSPEDVTDLLRPAPNDINNYYIEIEDENDHSISFISYQNIAQLNTSSGENPYTKPRVFYKLSITAHEVNSLFLPDIYYELTEEGHYLKASLWVDGRTYFLIDSAEEVSKEFYLPNTYYYQDIENDIYPCDSQVIPTYNVNNDYYKKTPLYVFYDRSGLCPRGYEWSVLSAYIPPSISLATLEITNSLIKIDKQEGSLLGLLLQFNNFYDSGNEITRNSNTLQGIHNLLKDLIFLIKTDFKPNSILYVNEFGQIESSNFKDYLKLKDILNKYDRIMSL